MYKMFINNVQIGNYNSVKDVFNSAIFTYLNGKSVSSVKWDGNSVFITY